MKTMKKIIITILIVSVYVLSCYHNKTWFSAAFGKDGRWSTLKPDMAAVIFTYIPGVNTVVTIFSAFDSPYRNGISLGDKIADKLIGEDN